MSCLSLDMFRRPLISTLVCQSVVATILSVSVFLIQGAASAQAFIFGCLVFALSNLYFAYYAFRFSLSVPSSAMVLTPWVLRSFQWGETGKLMLAGVGFALVFRFYSVADPRYVFAGFMSLQLLQLWIAHKIAQRKGRSCLAVVE